jgi:copper chaperone NosL
MKCMSTIAIALLGAFLIVPSPLRAAGNDLSEHRFCAFCGMDRKAYGYSRMLIEYTDGTVVGVCSLHCAVIDLNEHPSLTVKALLVADRDSRTLIDASTAFWVSGGRKRGVMTLHPAWAFRTQEGAAAFMKDHGGALSAWPEVLAAARNEVMREQ